MADYTPTTNGVSNRYLWWEMSPERQKARHGRSQGEIIAEFDRWLNQVKAEAWNEGHRHCFHVEDPNNPIKGNPYTPKEES